MHHNLIIKDGDTTKVAKEVLVDGIQFVDEKPRAGSTNPVTSRGVATAITEAVGGASDALQEQIDDIAEKAGSGYTPKGPASVSTLNGLTGQENGWLYTMTDAGTLTDGSLAVTAGDTVAWDATNSVWYKLASAPPKFENLCGSYTFKRTISQGSKVDIPFLEMEGVGVSVELEYATHNASDVINRYIRDKNTSGHSRLISQGTFTRITQTDLADNRQSYYISFVTFSTTQEVTFKVNFVSPIVAKKENPFISILAIGNSYTLDSFSYLPFILKNCGVDCKIDLMYKSAQYILAEDVNYDTEKYTIYKIDTRYEDKWSTAGSTYTIPQGLVLYNWDVISIQQASTQSVDSSTFASAKSLLNKIIRDANKNATLAWNINHSRKTNDSPSVILENCENAIKENPISLILPYGTAIFDARQDASLALVGAGGDLWYSDEVHLQEGLPCYLAALANAEAILERFFGTKTILGDTLQPNDTWLAEKEIPGQHGTSVGLTSENILKAQRIAIAANKFPFEILQSW